MQRSVCLPRILLMAACSLAIICWASMSAWAVNVNIDEVTIEIDDESYTSDDVEYIYVNSELAEITLDFSLDESSEDADWTLTLGASTNVSDQEFQSGKFATNASSASTSFTPRDVNVKLGDQNAAGDLVYSFKLTLQVTATTTEETTTNDGDEDVTTSETVTNTSPTQTIKIVVDRDPPETPTLDSTPSSGENSVNLTWEAVERSTSGSIEETEGSFMRYKVCARIIDDFGASSSKILDGDADDDLDESETETVEYEQEIEEVVEEDVAESAPEDDTEVEIPDFPGVDGDEDTSSDVEINEDDCILRTGITSNSYRFDGLTNGVVYGFRVKAVDAARNESDDWSNEVTATPRPVSDFWETYKEAGGKEKGGFCFIATAAFEGYDTPEVLTLRRFRDDVLARYELGIAFISLYYRWGAPAGAWLDEHPSLRPAARAALSPLVWWSRLYFAYGPTAALLVLLAACMLLGGATIGFRRFGKEAGR